MMPREITRGGSRRLVPLVPLLPPGTAVLPEDFPDRLTRIQEASGMSWNALAETLGVDPRQMARWKTGVEPSGGAMLALMRLASQMPGGMEVLLGNERGANGGGWSSFR
jgi:hypothetical protein